MPSTDDQEGLPPPDQPPTISVTISEPTIAILEVGKTAEFKCNARSLTGRPVITSWSKEGGDLPYGRSRDDGQGLLIITSVRVADSGTYVCTATDSVYGVAQRRAVLTVGGET